MRCQQPLMMVMMMVLSLRTCLVSLTTLSYQMLQLQGLPASTLICDSNDKEMALSLKIVPCGVTSLEVSVEIHGCCKFGKVR